MELSLFIDFESEQITKKVLTGKYWCPQPMSCLNGAKKYFKVRQIFDVFSFALSLAVEAPTTFSGLVDNKVSQTLPPSLTGPFTGTVKERSTGKKIDSNL